MQHRQPVSRTLYGRAMNSIFDYINYRTFLADYYAGNKAEKSYFSYRYFSRRAGIKSPVFLKLVIDGKRNLTESATEKFITALGFSEREALYFRHLVHFNQASTSGEKQEHYLVLKSMAGMVREHVVGADLFDLYDKWYTCVIRELVCLRDFGDDPAGIARAVSPSITPRQAREALELLLRMGLLKKREDGRYDQIHCAITTGHEVTSLAVRNFNREMLRLAAESLDRVPVERRNVSGMTMGISRECYDVLISEIEAFKDRVVKIVNNDRDSEDVYQLGIQLFPLSRQDKKEGGES